MFLTTLNLDILRKLEGLGEFIELGKGKSFGEGALLDNKPRAATILCKTDCYFAVMNKLDFMVQLHKIEAKIKTELLEFLHGHPLMKGWPESLIAKIIHAIPTKKFKRN